MRMMFDVIKVTLEKALAKKKIGGKKISMYRLAKDTGVAYSTLWKLKTGRVNSIDFDVLAKICDYLECKPNDLLVIEK